MQLTFVDERRQRAHHLWYPRRLRRAIDHILPAHDIYLLFPVSLHYFFRSRPRHDPGDFNNRVLGDFLIQMPQRIGQGVVVVLHHLLRLILWLAVPAQEIGGGLPRGKRALDHAGKHGFVNNRVVRHAQKRRAVKQRVPACKRGYGVALPLDARIEYKPERPARLILQRKLRRPRPPSLLQRRPERRNRPRHGQAVNDLRAGKIPFNKFFNQIVHLLSLLRFCCHFTTIFLPMQEAYSENGVLSRPKSRRRNWRCNVRLRSASRVRKLLAIPIYPPG